MYSANQSLHRLCIWRIHVLALHYLLIHDHEHLVSMSAFSQTREIYILYRRAHGYIIILVTHTHTHTPTHLPIGVGQISSTCLLLGGFILRRSPSPSSAAQRGCILYISYTITKTGKGGAPQRKYVPVGRRRCSRHGFRLLACLLAR